MSTSSIVGLIILALIVLVIVDLFYIARKYNNVEWNSKRVNFVASLCRAYCLKFHKLTIEQFKLPKTDGALLISNHVSGLDPLVLISACDRPIRFMIATEEYHRFGLKWLFKAAGCIPVDRTGRADIAFRKAKRALDSGEIVALFPHGKIHLDHETPYRVKPGIRKLTQLTHARVFVARITGVRGAGSVFAPMFKRSVIDVEQFPELDADYFDDNSEALVELGELLLGKRDKLSAK